MANQAIQQRARLWHAARGSAPDDVARIDGEKQVGPAPSSAGGANTSNAGTALLFFVAEREVDPTIHHREQHVQSR